MVSPQSIMVTALLALPLAAQPLAISPEAHGVTWDPWMLLVPIDHPEGSGQIAPAHSPEEELRFMGAGKQGPDLEATHPGKGGHKLHWQRLDPESQPRAEPSTAHIKFAEHFPEGINNTGLTDNAAAYLYRAVRAEEKTSLTVELGSDDGCRVWLNGELVYSANMERGVIYRDDSLKLELEEGLNHLLVKVANGGGAWGFQLWSKLEFTPAVRQKMQLGINAAIDRGVEFLFRTQQRDGSWAFHAGRYRNGQTALSLYAILKSGVSVEHQSVQRALAYLRQRRPRKTYSTTTEILALAAAHRDGDGERIEALVEQLVDWQQGSFGYPAGEHDLSCTQYGALGYWIGDSHGYAVPERSWNHLARSALKFHNPDGGFSYKPNGASTGAMTVAGLTVIAVCRQHFCEDDFPKRDREKLEKAHSTGMDWLAEHFTVSTNPHASGDGNTQHKYYYLYGLERLAALLGASEFGTHNWYWEGASHLLQIQGDEGQWASAYGEPEPNTAFALLFLNRATGTISGPGASSGQRNLYATSGEDAQVIMRAKGDTPLSLWLSEIQPSVRASHRREGEEGQGLYLEAVEYFANGMSIARMAADSTKLWRGETFAMQHTFSRRGVHTLQLKLHFADVPGAEGGRPATVSSALLEVRVDALMEDWMLDYTDDQRASLAISARKEMRASSTRGGNGAALAFDNLQSTAWVCAADDGEPSVTVEFRRALRIDRVVLSHCSGTQIHFGKYDRATRVSIDLGGKRKPILFDMNPDEFRKTICVLPRKVRVTRLTVRVLDRLPGRKFPGSVGFSEVELRLGDE